MAAATDSVERIDYVRRAYAVWELTLRCNLACVHCGSRAGPPRQDELSTAEALDLVEQLAEAGITDVTLEGGEAFLRRDVFQIARAIDAHGMRCSLLTGGFGVSQKLADRLVEAGVRWAACSIDGLETTHDHIRGRKGSYQQVLKTLDHFRRAGMSFGCNTQVNRLSAPELPRLYEVIRDAGARVWQVQLTLPMGNAADNWGLIHAPYELPELYPVLARVFSRANREDVKVTPGNNIGYFGPYERVLREAVPEGADWMGCQAGLFVIGIHANGEVKACPTLPAAFVGGNVRETRLVELLERPLYTFNDDAGTDEGAAHLSGFCGTCTWGAVCRGGCTAVTHNLLGARGNNPWCHYRSLELAARGQRERIALVERAPGTPFDSARFEIIEEPADAPHPTAPYPVFTADAVIWPPGWEDWPTPAPRPPVEVVDVA